MRYKSVTIHSVIMLFEIVLPKNERLPCRIRQQSVLLSSYSNQAGGRFLRGLLIVSCDLYPEDEYVPTKVQPQTMVAGPILINRTRRLPGLQR